MKITIIKSDGVVGVNGKFFQVDLSALSAAVHAVQFDTSIGKGFVESSAQGVAPTLITTISTYQSFVNAWQAAKDAEDAAAAAALAEFNSPAAVAERQRLADLETAIGADAQITALKAMTNAEFDAFWDANVTNATQAIAVLKRLTRVMVRRVL